MPALITHYLFGEEILDYDQDYLQGINDDEELRHVFLLGCQGPDPFFFAVHGKNAETARSYASCTHKHRIDKQFLALREALDYCEIEDRAVARAYMLGFLAHYQLDHKAHPYVYAYQYALIDSLPSQLSGANSCVHAVIESDIDSALLYKLKGIEAPSLHPIHCLQASTESLKTIGLLHSFIARKVYGLPLEGRDFLEAVQDMRIAYKLLESRSGSSAQLLGKLERLKTSHSILASLSHRWNCDKTEWQLNQEHHSWQHPFTKEECSASFFDIFCEALDGYEENFNNFITGQSEKISQRTNYNGQPLSEDEEEVLVPLR